MKYGATISADLSTLFDVGGIIGKDWYDTRLIFLKTMIEFPAVHLITVWDSYSCGMLGCGGLGGVGWGYGTEGIGSVKAKRKKVYGKVSPFKKNASDSFHEIKSEN